MSKYPLKSKISLKFQKYNDSTTANAKEMDAYKIEKNSQNLSKIDGKCQRTKDVAIFIAIRKSSLDKLYNVSMTTMNCYAKMHGYRLFWVDLENDTLSNEPCAKYRLDVVYFRRHCALARYMRHYPQIRWWLALDADVMVVNPTHCIDEYIDERVQIIFYERLMNYEIMTGGLLAKNTEWTQKFLDDFADYEFVLPTDVAWHGYDNGAIHMHLLKTLMPNQTQMHKICNRFWHQSKDLGDYFRFTLCCRNALGARRIHSPYFKLIRRAHGWAYDLRMIMEKWCDQTFMGHGFKMQHVGKGKNWTATTEILTELPTGSYCAPNTRWPYNEDNYLNCTDFKTIISGADQHFRTSFYAQAKTMSLFLEPDIGECWPQCSDDM